VRRGAEAPASATSPPGAIVAVTASAEETRELGAAVARVLQPGDVVVLTGGLGVGKTTLVQGIARGLGIEDPVTSPTFTLVRPYTVGRRGLQQTGLPEAAAHVGSAPASRRSGRPTQGTSMITAGSGIRRLLHADLYRLERAHEVLDLALDELVEDDAVVVVEWGERATGLLRPPELVVELEPVVGREPTVELEPVVGREPTVELEPVVGREPTDRLGPGEDPRAGGRPARAADEVPLVRHEQLGHEQRRLRFALGPSLTARASALAAVLERWRP
jgi:tRNA threonylcarbamoyladenosine biosynthesis protein TsaE